MTGALYADSLRIGLVAGELSGDQLGASLIEAVRARCPQARFEGIAGPNMRDAGCRALARSEQLSVMGLVEVLAKLPGLLRLRRKVARHFLQDPPDVFVGIDAPDFNLGLERTLKCSGIPTIHWVSPSVWAWRDYRLKKIRRSVDLMLTLLPFEAQYYDQRGIAARFVGHPLADEIADDCSSEQARTRLGLALQGPCVALLPGSRETEVKRLLPVFIETARLCAHSLPGIQFVLPVATERLLPLCKSLLGSAKDDALPLTLVTGRAREAMAAADTVLLASGTATLECMLVKRPMVVAYRMNPLSHALVSRMLQVPYVSLPNNLLGKKQVPEFIQGDAQAGRLADALLELLEQPEKAAQQIRPFADVHRQLRRDAAQQAAIQVIERGIQ